MAWTVLTLSFLLCLVSGEYNDGIITLAQQVKSLDGELRQLKIDFPRLEDKLFNSMELSQLAFRHDMKQYIVPELIQAHVRDVLVDLVRDNSLDSMINSHVTSEIQHLKIRYSLLKIQHQQMSREVSHLKEDRAMVTSRLARNFAIKIEHLEGINNRLNHSLNNTMKKVKDLKGDNKKLKRKYVKLRDSLHHVQTEVKTMEGTCQCKNNLSLKTELMVTNQREQFDRCQQNVNNMSQRINQLEVHQNVLQKEFTILQRKHYLNHNDSITSTQRMSTLSPRHSVRSRVLITTTERPRIPEIPPPNFTSGPKLHMIALNNPMAGDMRGIRGADYECHRQARQAGFRGTFRAFLSSQTQNLDDIIYYSSDRNVPVVNAKGEMLFNRWEDIVNGAGGYINEDSSIYAFNGKDIMRDSAWPQKIIWHGSDSKGQLRRDKDCHKWLSNNHGRMGFASSLMKHMLLDTEEFACNNSFIVLCIENTSGRNLQK